jgi:hypothetical protein
MHNNGRYTEVVENYIERNENVLRTGKFDGTRQKIQYKRLPVN